MLQTFLVNFTKYLTTLAAPDLKPHVMQLHVLPHVHSESLLAQRLIMANEIKLANYSRQEESK